MQVLEHWVWVEHYLHENNQKHSIVVQSAEPPLPLLGIICAQIDYFSYSLDQKENLQLNHQLVDLVGYQEEVQVVREYFDRNVVVQANVLRMVLQSQNVGDVPQLLMWPT